MLLEMRGPLLGATMLLVGCTRPSATPEDATIPPARVRSGGNELPATEAVGATSLATGTQHACATWADGLLWCWGHNDAGQIPGLDRAVASRPVLVDGIRDAVQVTATGASTCVRTSTGRVGCWGPPALVRALPEAERGIHWFSLDATDISVGNLHGCAVVDGGVQCWGTGPGDGRHHERFGKPGTLSYGPTPSRGPTPIPGVGASRVAAGNAHTCAFGERLTCWGHTDDAQAGGVPPKGQLPFAPPNPIETRDAVHALALSENISCLADVQGVSCLGAVPQAVGRHETTPRPRPVVDLLDVVDLDVAEMHGLVIRRGCAVTTSGRVMCWGHPLDERAPSDDMFTRAHPVPGLEDAVEVSLGEEFACARTRRGRVACWGQVGFGQLGDGQTLFHDVPITAAPFASALRIAAGDDHTCAILRSGEVRCAGYRDPREYAPQPPEPTVWTETALRNAEWLSGRIEDLCIMTPRGRVACSRVAGGHTNRVWPAEPAKRKFETIGNGFVSIASGKYHHCGITKRGQVRCWGENGFGAFGRGDVPDRDEPAVVPGVRAVTGIASATGSTCVTTKDGAVLCWGDDQAKQLGRTTAKKFYNGPAPVPGLSSVRELVGGDHRYCAVKGDGRVTCWGDYEAELADVPALRGTTGLATHEFGTCGITAERGLVCQMPDGAVVVDGLQDVRQISVGRRHACALSTDGTTRCWGNNESGALGSMQAPRQTTPVWLEFPASDGSEATG